MSEIKVNEIDEKEILSFLTNRKYFFIDDDTEDQLYFKLDRSGYMIDEEGVKHPFSWTYIQDKNTLKLILPNKKVVIFIIQDFTKDESIKVRYADKETKRNTYLIKKEKENKVTHIKSVDLTGFEVSYLWSDSKTNNIYSFLDNGDGIIITPDEDESIDFKWYIDESNIVKIGFRSKVISIKLEEKVEDNFYIVQLEDDLGNYSNINFTRITVKEEPNPLLDSKLEKPEKIFLSFIGFSLFLFLFIVLQILFLTKGMSFLIQFAIALCITMFFIIKFKNYFAMICKKDRVQNKGRKFGKIINLINNSLLKPIEKIIYK